MKLRDKLNHSCPAWSDMIDRMDKMINLVNNLASVVFQDMNPHKVNDSTNVVSAKDAGSLDVIADLEKELQSAYETHIASTTYHKAADSTNVITASSVYEKVKALADDLKAKYNAHHVFITGSVHAGSDDPNTVTEPAVSDKATAITLANQIKTMFNLHLNNITSCHGAVDTANLVTLDDLLPEATWEQIQALLDDIRTKYEAHRVNVTASVHGGADATNAMAVSAVGSVQTSVNTFLTEMKGDLNAHMLNLTSHNTLVDNMQITAANATSLVTARLLANAIKAAYMDHISTVKEMSYAPIPTLDER
jgi:hypothetical protein